MRHILFVCTANQIRSPLAAASFRKLVEQRNQASEWLVDSAGTWADEGFPMVESAKLVGLKLGLPGLAEHRSKPVSQKLLEQAAIVLVMETNHKEALRAEFPAFAAKIYLMSELAPGPQYDIPDPGTGAARTDDVAKEIDMILRRGFDRLETLAKASANKSE